ncbi:6920_t:CDS:2, partial [Scutellospora calospora]
MTYFQNNATTDWRLLLSEDERKHNVGRLYKGLELLNRPNVYAQQRFHASKQWENESYNNANSKDEYNQLIGAKLRDLTNEIQRTAQLRQQQAQRSTAPSQQSQVTQQQAQQAQTLQQRQQQHMYQQLLQQNPALQQQNQIQRMQQIQRSQQQQQQLQATPQQIASVQANNFIRPVAQIPSSPKSTQPGGAHRPNLLQQQQLMINLGFSPDTQLSPEVMNKLGVYMRMQQAAQQQQDNMKVNQQAVAGNSIKLSNNGTIQSPVNQMKGQAPSQSPGTMFMMSNSGPPIANSHGNTPNQSPAIVNASPVPIPNKTTPNLSPNAVSNKMAASLGQLKLPQNKIASPAANVAPNPGMKVSSGVDINTIQNLGLMPGFQGAITTNGRPNVITANANTIMLTNNNNPANQASSGANAAAILAAQNAMFANARPPMNAVRPKHPIMRPMLPINNSTAQSGQLATLSEKDEKEALAMISQIDSKTREKSIQYHEIDLSEDDKRQIMIKLTELTPMYEKVDEVLPYFWHYTRSSQGTSRLLHMKYMIKDQLNALKTSRRFLLKLDLVENLLQQFRKYFVFVDSRRRGIEDTSGLLPNPPVPPQQPQPQNVIRPPIDLKLPMQPRTGVQGTSSNSSIPPRKRPSEQEAPQSNKKPQHNNVFNRPPSINSNPIVIPDDTKQITSEIQEINNSDKNGITTEDYHAGSQLLANKLKSISPPRVMRSGPTMAQIEYSPYEE